MICTLCRTKKLIVNFVQISGKDIKKKITPTQDRIGRLSKTQQQFISYRRTDKN